MKLKSSSMHDYEYRTIVMSQQEAEDLCVSIEKALVDVKHGKKGDITVYSGKADLDDGYPEWLNRMVIQFKVGNEK